MDRSGTDQSMSTNSTKDNKYKHIRIMDRSSMDTRGSIDRNIFYNHNRSRKWSNERLKDELSSLIAEFSYITDESTKTSKEKYPISVTPYHVYATDTTTVTKGPFKKSSHTEYIDSDEKNERLVKVVERKDNRRRKQSSHKRPSKKENENSYRRTYKAYSVPSRHKSKFNRSRSERGKVMTMNGNNKRSFRSRSRSKYKSPQKSSHRKPIIPKRSRSRLESKSSKRKLRVSSSGQREKGPRKSRSRRRIRRKKSRSRSHVELDNKRSGIMKTRASSYERFGERGSRHIVFKSKSNLDVIESQSIPIGHRKRSKPLYKGFYPFRYDRNKEERKNSPIGHRKRSKSVYKGFYPFRYERKKEQRVIRRRRSIPVIRKYEVVDSIPSEAATILTIYPQLHPKNEESKVEPVFLTDQTLPCKCFHCMRKYKSFVKIPRLQSPHQKQQPRVHSCKCQSSYLIMEDYQDIPYLTRKLVTTKLPKYPYHNMPCDFGACAMSVSGIPQHELIKKYFQEIPYSCHDNIPRFCHSSQNYFSTDPESGYITGNSVKSIYFKFNCYAHHIDSTITRHFHSILGQTNLY